MQHDEVYKGHHLVVRTLKQTTGYAWNYLIDNVTFREMRDRPIQSEQLMLEEGIREAKSKIDRM